DAGHRGQRRGRRGRHGARRPATTRAGGDEDAAPGGSPRDRHRPAVAHPGGQPGRGRDAARRRDPRRALTPAAAATFCTFTWISTIGRRGALGRAWAPGRLSAPETAFPESCSYPTAKAASPSHPLFVPRTDTVTEFTGNPGGNCGIRARTLIAPL